MTAVWTASTHAGGIAGGFAFTPLTRGDRRVAFQGEKVSGAGEALFPPNCPASLVDPSTPLVRGDFPTAPLSSAGADPRRSGSTPLIPNSRACAPYRGSASLDRLWTRPSVRRLRRLLRVRKVGGRRSMLRARRAVSAKGAYSTLPKGALPLPAQEQEAGAALLILRVVSI